MEANGRKIHKMNWNEFNKAIDELCPQIKGEEFDYVYGIPRGGLIPAIVLSHKLDIPFLLPNQEFFETKRSKILIVDDISDSGRTLSNFTNLILNKGLKVSTLVLYMQEKSRLIPNYYYKEIEDTWIIFPWETEETSVGDYFKEEEE